MNYLHIAWVRQSENFFKRLTRSVLAGLLALVTVTSVNAAIPASERQALIDVYNGTGGAAWTNRSGWLGTVGTECSWYGATCNATETNIKSLTLAENNLRGALPPTLNRLTEIEAITVVNNAELSGPIPSLSGLSHLISLQLYDNRLTGSIPSLAGLTSLAVLELGSNELTGHVPSLSSTAALRRIYVDNNKLSGAIPFLQGLSYLEIANFASNYFTGPIPALSGLTALSILDVAGNQLTGTLPPIASLTALTFLSVLDNQLSGPLPVPPTSLIISKEAFMCVNQFTYDPLATALNTAWNVATNQMSWNTNCIAARPQLMLSLQSPPSLTVGGTGQVRVLVSLPGSTVLPALQPTVFASLTPNVCSVASLTGFVSVSPVAQPGSVCTITVDKAGNEVSNSAQQVQQSIVIAAALAVAVPTLATWALIGLAILMLSIGVALSSISRMRISPRTSLVPPRDDGEA